MFSKDKIILAFITAFVCLYLAVPGTASAYYNVSGVVEFSYRDYETKIGDMHQSDVLFTQTYRANLSSFVWDPRFMRFNAGVGYNILKSNHSADSDQLDYNLSASFFPGMKYSWDLFGRKSVNSIQSNDNIAGYDVTTTSYGGTLYLNFGSKRGGGNNNNNNNYNNYNNYNNNRRAPIPLPDISLSRSHTEAESMSSAMPLHEESDTTSATVNYLISPRLSVDATGGINDYSNLATGSSYETKNAAVSSVTKVSPDADFKVNGRMIDRSTSNFVNYDTNYTTYGADATLDFREKSGIAQIYQYSFSKQVSSRSDFTVNSGNAKITYRMNPQLLLYGGMNYGEAVSERHATVTTPTEEKSTYQTGGLIAGASYSKLYTPEFLGPFGFSTDYQFGAGFSKLSTTATGTAAQVTGSGMYYTNSVGLGLRSVSWKEETVGLGYSFMNRRDDSPLHNNTVMQNYQLAVASKRIPRTTIDASGNYAVQETSTDNESVILLTTGNTNMQTRTVNYNANVTHAATSFLSLSAGASLGQSATIQSYTLSTLPTSTTTQQQTLYYGAANFFFGFTRNLTYRAELREEHRGTDNGKTDSHIVNMYLDYRIRAIYLNFEYKWRQDMTDNSLRLEQQYYFVKLSRPF